MRYLSWPNRAFLSIQRSWENSLLWAITRQRNIEFLSLSLFVTSAEKEAAIL